MTAGSDRLLLDCGARWRDIQTALGFDTRNVAGCLVSHEHGDHTRAIPDAVRAGIDCFMSMGTAAKMREQSHRIRLVAADTVFAVGNFTVYPFETEHDAAEPLGFLVTYRPTREVLLYATDTFYLKSAFKGVHYFLVECNYSRDIAVERFESGDLHRAVYDRLMSSHMSLEHLKEFLAACDLTDTRRILLIHLSSGNADERRMVREIENLTGITTSAANAGTHIELTLQPF